MSRRTVLLTAIAVAVAATGSAGASARVEERLRAVACPAAAPLTPADLRYAREYRRLLAAHAADVWPGWRGVPPLLQRTSRCEYLIGHPSPPRPFRRVRGLDVTGAAVYAAPAGAATSGSDGSAARVGRIWTAIVPTRAERQRALDRRLGRGAVRLDDTLYVRRLAHEAFRAHQLTVARGAPPSFGSTLGERQAAALLARLRDAEARLVREGQALAAALGAASLAHARAAAADFATRRAQRRGATSAPAALAAFERRIEWADGAAGYADLRLALLAGDAAYRPTPGVRYRPAAASRSAFLAELGRTAPRREGLRGRWQALGAAQALLLDRLALGWREAVLPGRSSLETVLREAVEVPAELADLRVARLTVGGSRLNVAVADRPELRRKGLGGVRSLDPLDGMLFTYGEDVDSVFWMVGALIPLDIAFFAADGELLSVQTMPLCTSDPCPTYRSPRSYRFALEAPAGALRGLRAGARLVVPAGLG